MSITFTSSQKLSRYAEKSWSFVCNAIPQSHKFGESAALLLERRVCTGNGT
jgi:hypothetical protein